MLYRIGEKAPAIGNYDFVKHVDGTTSCTNEEQRIRLEKDEVFPPHRSCNKACYWKSA